MLGAVISGGLSALGGFMGMEGAKDVNATNAAIAERNIALQREFAQSGIQWRVKDAAKAGVHPLYALGASTTSFSPVSVGAVNEAAPMANALVGMGQDVSRAAAAYRGPGARLEAVQTAHQVAANGLQLENMKLQNDLLRSRLAVMNQPGTPPGVAFGVPENKKTEERPPLMVFGQRWDTNPNTSPMKAWEDQYGDEGPIAWGMPMVIGANDAVYNARNWASGTAPIRWLQEVSRALQQQYPYGRR